MTRFGPDPQAHFAAIYTQPAPWDIGRPQPDMLALLDAWPPAGPILDVGCGSGDLALELAQRGHIVVGIDFVARAIEQADAKRAALPPDVAARLTFIVGDGLQPSALVQPSALGQPFGTVVDSGFFHLFTPAQGDAFVADVARALRPGGRYYLHAFAVEFDLPNTPRRISAAELETRFTPARGWQIKALHSAEFHSRVAPPVAAICACVERLPAG